MQLKFLILLAPLLLAACAKEDSVAGATVGDAPVRVHFDYLGSCTRLLGNEGGYLVFQIKRVENHTADTFRFEPQRVRFMDANAQSQVPLLIVPEFSEIEVPARSEHSAEEPYLLQYRDAQAPELSRKIIAYDGPGTIMVPTDSNAGEQPVDCDQYAT